MELVIKIEERPKHPMYEGTRVYITTDGQEHRSSGRAGAWRKGAQAAVDGYTQHNCPYISKKKINGRLVWCSAFRDIWHEGYAWARNNLGDHLRGARWLM